MLHSPAFVARTCGRPNGYFSSYVNSSPDADAYPNSDSNSHAYSGADRYAGSDSHGTTNWYTCVVSNAFSNGYRYKHPSANGNSHARACANRGAIAHSISTSPEQNPAMCWC